MCCEQSLISFSMISLFLSGSMLMEIIILIGCLFSVFKAFCYLKFGKSNTWFFYIFTNGRKSWFSSISKTLCLMIFCLSQTSFKKATIEGIFTWFFWFWPGSEIGELPPESKKTSGIYNVLVKFIGEFDIFNINFY